MNLGTASASLMLPEDRLNELAEQAQKLRRDAPFSDEEGSAVREELDKAGATDDSVRWLALLVRQGLKLVAVGIEKRYGLNDRDRAA